MTQPCICPCTVTHRQRCSATEPTLGQGGPLQDIEWLRRRQLPGGTELLLRALDSQLRPETATWMAGYARVTADMSHMIHPRKRKRRKPVRYVVASPLYVEYTSSPA